MIISASRRTDIPAFYGEWLMRRLDAGYVVARNPMNPAQVRRVSLAPGDVDAIVFWTKDFRPLAPHLRAIRSAYPVCVQHTLTPYGAPLEPRLADKRGIIEGMRRIADELGPDCLVWRYDPVILSDRMDVGWHLRAFERACALLEGATHTCVFSFLQLYPGIRRAMDGLCIQPDGATKRALAAGMADIARAHGIALQTCCTDIDPAVPGIAHGACISPELIRAATGREVRAARDSGQRSACRCLKSVDIGAYNTCPHMCAYCYANHGGASVARSTARHDPAGEELLPPARQARPGGADDADLFYRN